MHTIDCLEFTKTGKVKVVYRSIGNGRREMILTLAEAERLMDTLNEELLPVLRAVRETEDEKRVRRIEELRAELAAMERGNRVGQSPTDIGCGGPCVCYGKPASEPCPYGWRNPKSILPTPRTKAEVTGSTRGAESRRHTILDVYLARKNNPGGSGCCERYANVQACDCLQTAVDYEPQYACDWCKGRGYIQSPRNGKQAMIRCPRGCPVKCSVCDDPNCDNPCGQH